MRQLVFWPVVAYQINFPNAGCINRPLQKLVVALFRNRTRMLISWQHQLNIYDCIERKTWAWVHLNTRGQERRPGRKGGGICSSAEEELF